MQTPYHSALLMGVPIFPAGRAVAGWHVLTRQVIETRLAPRSHIARYRQLVWCALVLSTEQSVSQRALSTRRIGCWQQWLCGHGQKHCAIRGRLPAHWHGWLPISRHPSPLGAGISNGLAMVTARHRAAPVPIGTTSHSAKSTRAAGAGVDGI